MPLQYLYQCEWCKKEFISKKTGRKFCTKKCATNYRSSLTIGKKVGPTGIPAWNRGIPNPLAAENGKKGAAKQSAKVTGRKRSYKEDGSWYWVYPNK